MRATDVEYVGHLDSAQARVLTDQIKAGVEAVWQLITRAYTERAWSALGYTSWDDYCTREFGTARLRLPREERAEVVASLRESGLSLRAITSATGISRPTIIKDLGQSEQVVNSLPPAEPIDCDGKCATDECICPLGDADEDALPEELGAFSHVPEQHLPPLPENYMSGIHADPAPTPVIGLDGKSYQPSRAKPAEPKEPRRSALTDQARNAGWELRKAVERVERIVTDDRFNSQKEKVASHLRGHLTDAITSCQAALDRINTSNKEDSSAQ